MVEKLAWTPAVKRERAGGRVRERAGRQVPRDPTRGSLPPAEHHGPTSPEPDFAPFSEAPGNADVTDSCHIATPLFFSSIFFGV